MFEIYSFVEGAACLHLTVVRVNLSPRPTGDTKHAGRGQASDGTSIPCPGCEFMFSRLNTHPYPSIWQSECSPMWQSSGGNLGFWLNSVD